MPADSLIGTILRLSAAQQGAQDNLSSRVHPPPIFSTAARGPYQGRGIEIAVDDLHQAGQRAAVGGDPVAAPAMVRQHLEQLAGRDLRERVFLT